VATEAEQARAIVAACRSSLAAYGAYVHGLQPAKHHREWLVDLRDVGENGGKLLLMAPPGWAKSTWLMIFMEWFLGNHPDHSVLFLTSDERRATAVNTAVRSMMEGEKYALVFPDAPCRPDKDRGWSGAGLWLKGTPAESTNPAFVALGFTSNIIGSRPHLIVMDDPRNQEQAQSETEQIAAKAYHDGTIVSRLHPDKPREVCISTRWHASDLIGHLMEQGGWKVRNLPALDEQEQSTWPDRFSTEYVLEMRRLLGTAMFRMIWMGDPTSMGGAFYREEKWFRPLPADFDKRSGPGKKSKRESLTVVQFWDLAYSERETADYSACVTMGMDRELNLYVLGAWRGKRDEANLAQAIVDQYEMYQPVGIGVERGIWDKSQAVKDILRQVRRQILLSPWLIEAKGKKEERALLPAGRAENGMFFVDREAPWAHDYMAELLAFNLGKNDDWVDATSGAAELFNTKMAFMIDLRKLPKQRYSFGAAKKRPVAA
jgi:predicted phage terminase large subunit-like protein